MEGLGAGRDRACAIEIEFGTLKGLEQYAWEDFLREISRNDGCYLSGPDRLKSDGAYQSGRRLGERSSQTEGTESGPDWLKVLRE